MKLFLKYDLVSESEIKPYIKNDNTPVCKLRRNVMR